MQKKQPTPTIERISKIWQPDAWININNLSFASPAFGPTNYQKVGKEILEKELTLSTGEEIAPLIYSAYCIPEIKDEPEFQNIRQIMKNNWFWVGNRNLWTSKGVYIIKDPRAIGRSQTLDINELEAKLEGAETYQDVRQNPETGISFAPKQSYKLGEHTPESLSKDGFMIASYGVKGAENLGEVSASTQFKNLPYIYGLDIKEGQNPKQTLSALFDNWCLDYGLYVDGNVWVDVDDGLALGVVPEKRE